MAFSKISVSCILCLGVVVLENILCPIPAVLFHLPARGHLCIGAEHSSVGLLERWPGQLLKLPWTRRFFVLLFYFVFVFCPGESQVQISWDFVLGSCCSKLNRGWLWGSKCRQKASLRSRQVKQFTFGNKLSKILPEVLRGLRWPGKDYGSIVDCLEVLYWSVASSQFLDRHRGLFQRDWPSHSIKIPASISWCVLRFWSLIWHIISA